MSKFIKRVASGMGAYSYAQFVTIGTQLLALPIFLNFWSMETYGEWLMLSAVPIYFSMSDLGIVAVAGNKMTMAIANNEPEQANKIFQSALLMTLFMISSVLLISLSCLFIVDFDLLNKSGYKIALGLLITSSLLSTLGGLVDAIFKANKKYALGTFLITTVRLVEWIFAILAVYLYEKIIFAAAGILLARILMTLFNITYTAYKFKTIKWSLKESQWEIIKSMLKPSIAFMALPVGNAISLQGMTLIVGTILSPATVVIFNTYRTLSRLLFQVSAVLSKPLWPEFSRLYGLKEKSKILKVYFISIVITTFAMACGFIFLYFMANDILQYWTSGKIIYMEEIFMLFVLSTCIAGIAQVTTTVLAATNLHVGYFSFFLVATLIFVYCTSQVAPQYGLTGIAWTQVIYEIALLLMGMIFLFKKVIHKKTLKL